MTTSAEQAAQALIAQVRNGQQPGPTQDAASLIEQVRGQSPQGVSTAGGMAGAALDGLLLGGGDEYLAGLAAVMGLQPDGQGGASWFEFDRPLPERYNAALAEIRADQEAYRGAEPGRALTAEILGAVSPLLASRNPETARPLLSRAARGGVAGGAMGGAYGFLEGEGGFQNRRENAGPAALFGAGVGAAIPGLGTAFQAFRNFRAANRAVREGADGAPTTEELRRQGNDLYNRIDAEGAEVSGPAFNSMAGQLTSDMMDSGLARGNGALALTPRAAEFTNLLDDAIARADANGGSIPLSELQRLRQQAGIVAGTIGNNTEQSLGTMATRALDDFMENITPEQLTGGRPENVGPVLAEARDVWARMRRSGLIDEVIERSQNYRSGPESGLRAGFQGLLNNRRLMRGFSEAEIQAMRRVVNSRDFNTILRQIGRFGVAVTGGSSGLGAATGAGMGAIAGGPIGAVAVPAAATVARMASERATTNRADLARRLVASPNPTTLPMASGQPLNTLEAAMRRATIAGAN